MERVRKRKRQRIAEMKIAVFDCGKTPALSSPLQGREDVVDMLFLYYTEQFD
jgi:hypothetical protein